MNVQNTGRPQGAVPVTAGTAPGAARPAVRRVPGERPAAPQSEAERRAEAERRRMAAAREHAKKRERRRKAKWLLIAALLCLSCVLIYVISRFLGSFFIVGEINVEGESPYSADELIAASGISWNDKLYRTDKKAAEESISAKLPYISSVSVKIKLPSFVYSTVSSYKAVMYACIAGDYYALSGDMRVLERADKPDRFEAAGLMCVTLPQVGNAVVGTQLTLADGTDPGYIGRLVDVISGSELAGRVTKLFIDERFNTVLTVDGKYRVRFGSDAGAANKALAAARVIDECGYDADATAVIDVSDPAVVVAVKREGLDLTSKSD